MVVNRIKEILPDVPIDTIEKSIKETDPVGTLLILAVKEESKQQDEQKRTDSTVVTSTVCSK